MRAAAAIAALSCALVFVAGCSDMVEEGTQNEKERDKRAEQNRTKKLDEDCDKLAATIQKEPLDLDNNKYAVDKIAGEAQIAGLAEKMKPRFDKMKKDADDAFAAGAEAKTKEAVEAARKLSGDGKAKEARKRIEGLPNRLRSTPQWKVCEDELAHLDQLERADAVWTWDQEKVKTMRGRGEWEKARGVYESFLALAEAVPAFKESVHAKEAEKAIAELKPELEKSHASKAAADSIKWIPAFSGRKADLAQWDIDLFDSANVDKEGVCVFKFGGGGENPYTYMRYGKDDWEDYVIEADVKIVKGPVYLNVHGFPDGDGRKFTDVCQLQEFDVPKDKWVQLRLEARGGEITIFCNGSATSTNGKKAKAEKGSFEFRIGRGAEIQLKKVWVKVYKPAAAAPAPAGK